MKFKCEITAQRKHRPLYFTSDEQFQWMIAILQHFIPDINLELEGLKAIGAQLGIEGPASPGAPQVPTRNLPASMEGVYLKLGTSTSNQSEVMSDRSQSPERDASAKDEVNAAEGLLTDTGVSESLRFTSPETRMSGFC
jgi:hypothetical protein